MPLNNSVIHFIGLSANVFDEDQKRGDSSQGWMIIWRSQFRLVEFAEKLKTVQQNKVNVK